MRPRTTWKRLLAGVLAMMLCGVAYAGFITTGTALPGTKRDLTPLPPGADPTRYIAAADYNALMNALNDVRTFILNGTFLGFAAQAVHPTVPPNGSAYNLWVKSTNTHLIYTANGVDFDLSTGGAASTLATVYSSGSSAADQTMTTVASRPVLIKATGAATGQLFHVQDSGSNDLLDISDIDRALVSGAAANAGTNVGVRTNAKTALTSGRKYLAVANGATDQWAFYEATGTNSTTPTLEAVAGIASQIYGNGNLLISASSAGDSYVQTLAGGNAALVSLVGNVILYAAGSISVSNGASLVPSTDSTNALGAASQRWKYVAVGAAVASQPTCDATTRGGTMTIFATAGNSDTLQVCMKAAANTYAWRTVFTAP